MLRFIEAMKIPLLKPISGIPWYNNLYQN